MGSQGTIVNKVSIRGGFDLTGLISGLTIFERNLKNGPPKKEKKLMDTTKVYTKAYNTFHLSPSPLSALIQN